MNVQDDIERLLKTHGPLTGGELSEKLPDITTMDLWRQCYASDDLRVSNCARYYLRYDITRGNQLRLSPSILRDFLTFSLIYLSDQIVDIIEDGTRLANKFRAVSLRKLGWAREALLQLEPELQQVINEHCVVFLSGDIAYYLAHETPRQHSQLNVPVNGSDIDIVIITNRGADPVAIKAIESQLLTIKKGFLITPDIHEELDFIVKPVETMINQLAYRDIHEKIASKILYESYFLMGRVDIYHSLMKHLSMTGTRAKIEKDFETALGQRRQTIWKILSLPPEASTKDPEVESLFFASKERLEFR